MILLVLKCLEKAGWTNSTNPFSLDAETIIRDLILARIPLGHLAGRWLPTCFYTANPLEEHTSLFPPTCRSATTQKALRVQPEI